MVGHREVSLVENVANASFDVHTGMTGWDKNISDCKQHAAKYRKYVLFLAACCLVAGNKLQCMMTFTIYLYLFYRSPYCWHSQKF